jgi:hypothetical protein
MTPTSPQSRAPIAPLPRALSPFPQNVTTTGFVLPPRCRYRRRAEVRRRGEPSFCLSLPLPSSALVVWPGVLAARPGNRGLACFR